MSPQRLLKEYREAKSAKPDPEITLNLTDETDIFQWSAHLKGPVGTPYEGGTFVISLRCLASYPLAPPTCTFVTPVFHPCVRPSVRSTILLSCLVCPHLVRCSSVLGRNVLFKTGEICLDILKPDAWTPAWTLQSVCRAIIVLLSHPEADSPLHVSGPRTPADFDSSVSLLPRPAFESLHHDSNCDCGNMIRNGDLRGYRSMAKMYSQLHAGAPFPDVLDVS